MVGAFQNHIAIGQHGLDVAAFVGRGAYEVTRIVAAQIAQHAPVVFRMHEHRVVFWRCGSPKRVPVRRR